MLTGFQNITKIPELKKKIWFSLAMLAVYRVGVHIPTPGIDTVALAAFFKRAQGTLFGLFDMFSGGALENMSVFALGIMPYISASIILDLLTVVIPYLEKLKKEGEAGRKKITQYARYGTVVLSIFQGLGIAIGMESMGSPGGGSVVMDPGWSFRLMTMITLTSGTAFIMWLGEQITERGIGNGISLIIFAGIVARMPTALANTGQLVRTGELNFIFIILLILLMVAVVGFIVFVERGQRRIPVQYAKRVVGRKVYGGQSTHLPLKINTSGVIPPIFASSILMFPATITQFIQIQWLSGFVRNYMGVGGLLYSLIYVGLDFFLLLFLHGRHLQPGGCGREYEEIRRVYPRDPPGEMDGRLYRPCADPHHLWRGPLRFHRLCAAHGVDLPF